MLIRICKLSEIYRTCRNTDKMNTEGSVTVHDEFIYVIGNNLCQH